MTLLPFATAARNAACALMLALSPAIAQDRPVATPRTITISASGQVAAEPDIAHVTLGVVAEGDTAKDALARNTVSMRKVVDGLKGAGIEPRDIQTSRFHVEPRYQTYKDGRPPVINGYRVSNSVRITVRAIARLGEVLDQVVGLGANQLGGIVFQVSRAETLKDEARQKAMENARRRADLYARAAGAEVGPVITISEEVVHNVPRPMSMPRATAAAAEAVPIEAGSQQLEVRVTVTWGLR